MENTGKKEKSKIIKWVENLWFYHKWHILVGALVITMLTIATVQCIMKSEPDIAILYVAANDIEGDREHILEQFGDAFDDVNGDGEKSISFAFMGTGDSATPTRVQTEMAAGDHYIYIVNDEYYKRMVDSGILAPLHEALGLEHPNATEDGYGIRIKYLHIGETRGFGSVERNSILCIRGNDRGHVDTGSASKYYMNNLKFFRALCAYNDGGEHIQTSIGFIGKQTMNQDTVYAMEYSVYNIYREKDQGKVPLLNYSDIKVTYDEYGQAVLNKEQKEAIMAFAQGNKVLLVDEAVYELLRDEGRLVKFDTLGLTGDSSEEKYGIKLSGTNLLKTPGFASAKSSMYLCGTADINGNNAELLKYMREWNENEGA